jgi:dodecin
MARPESLAAAPFRKIRQEEAGMADIAKVITIIGNHPESFAKAAEVAVQEAAKTVRGISGADVISMSCEVEGERISMYRTTVNIAFAVER